MTTTKHISIMRTNFAARRGFAREMS